MAVTAAEQKYIRKNSALLFEGKYTKQMNPRNDAPGECFGGVWIHSDPGYRLVLAYICSDFTQYPQQNQDIGQKQATTAFFQFISNS